MPRLVRAALLLAAAPLAAAAQSPSAADLARWQREASAVTITRDDWGIAHVRGHTDADAVFGMIYAQAEDDFNRVETNYLDAMGRRAEAEGEGAVFRDLRMKLFIDPDSMKAKYAASPQWLRSLMDAWADGLDYYLATHPDVHPRVITRFEPWMALTFSEGSIGGDIESISLQQLQRFYGPDGPPPVEADKFKDDPQAEPSGSNGVAIAPMNTASHHALLLINPHTSFFFRSELQMTSDEGLNAYGAVTWGQFFVYQGFNTRTGWMHTSSGVDAIDEFAEAVSKRGDRYYYRHAGRSYPVATRTIVVPYRTASGMARKTFTVFGTQHGPIVRAASGRWISVALMEDPVKALTQSYTRTKARSYAEFRQSMELHTNSSNNTIYADADGHIAYFHANYIPRRNPRFDWTKPVDGSDSATDYHGVLSIDESPNLLDPKNGWLFNTNDSPWNAAGPYSPKQSAFPAYVQTGGENARGTHATLVLQGKHDFTLASLIAAAFDSRLTEFDTILPPLFRAWDALPAGDSLRAALGEQIDTLRRWDRRWSATSVPTSLAVFWGEALMRRATPRARAAGLTFEDYVATRATPEELVGALATATQRLTSDFGAWKTPWGTINRFQRLTGDIEQPFTDAGPSIPVPFTSSLWGSLASFGARPYPNTKKWYGTSGNSFVGVVEFGDSVRARAITAGGESGHPSSKHFDDEAARYASGNLREVYYYPSQLVGHTERVYHPGR